MRNPFIDISIESFNRQVMQDKQMEKLEFKGTPGSWHIEERGASILDNTGKSIVCWYGVATSTYWKEEEQLKANSKLLAAAPDLLEALQGLLKEDRVKIAIIESGALSIFNEKILKANLAIEKALK